MSDTSTADCDGDSRVEGGMKVHRNRNRKGATMVLVALLMTVLVGITGIAIDMSRFYTIRAQLQTSADAAALAAVVEVKNKPGIDATAIAQGYAQRNRVEQQTALVLADSVQPGTWDFNAGGFARTTWSDPKMQAVRVAAIYPGAYTFARVFGVTTDTLKAVAVAALGYVGGTDCLKPWAVSYRNLLEALYPAPNTPDPLAYSLTPDDVNRLAANKTPITLLLGGSNQYSPGNIGQVIVNDPWSGNNSYKDAITGPSCANMVIGPGTWLNSLPGAGGGQSAKSVQTLCGVKGNPQSFACNVEVKLAVWDCVGTKPQCTDNPPGGANLQYRVKFVGAFVLTHYDAGKTGSDPAQLTGYFSTMASSGGFTSTPTPLSGAVAIVE